MGTNKEQAMTRQQKKVLREVFIKEMNATYARAMGKIKARMDELAKDPELLKQMDKEIHGELCPTKTTSKEEEKNKT